jgi:hypothetical protein
MARAGHCGGVRQLDERSLAAKVERQAKAGTEHEWITAAVARTNAATEVKLRSNGKRETT